MELQSRRFADTVVVAPAGRVDHTTAEAFKGALTGPLERCAAGQDRVVLDLSGLEYISSAGLRVLMLASRQVKARGGTIVVAALAPLVREVFEVARFTLVFDTFPTVRDALAVISPVALAAFDGL